MATYKYVSDDNLLYVWQKLKLLLNNKVDKENGKGLFSGSYNDLTNKPSIAGVTLSGNKSLSDLGIQPSGDYPTNQEMTTAINNALAGITEIEFRVVSALPSTPGENGVIYLVAVSQEAGNNYEEYIYVNNAYEKIGTTDVDLSGYVKTTDLVELTNVEIDEIMV